MAAEDMGLNKLQGITVDKKRKLKHQSEGERSDDMIFVGL